MKNQLNKYCSRHDDVPSPKPRESERFERRVNLMTQPYDTELPGFWAALFFCFFCVHCNTRTRYQSLNAYGVETWIIRSGLRNRVQHRVQIDLMMKNRLQTLIKQTSSCPLVPFTRHSKPFSQACLNRRGLQNIMNECPRPHVSAMSSIFPWLRPKLYRAVQISGDFEERRVGPILHGAARNNLNFRTVFVVS